MDTRAIQIMFKAMGIFLKKWLVGLFFHASAWRTGTLDRKDGWSVIWCIWSFYLLAIGGAEIGRAHV